MSKQCIGGIWVIVCDWKDPVTEEVCKLGKGGEPSMFIDPERGQGKSLHFQCGRHHGVVPQKEKPEFQLPKGHKLTEEIFRPGAEMDGIEVEEAPDGE